MTKHQQFESEMKRVGLADHFCSNFFMRKTDEGYLHQVCDDFWTIWNVGRSVPVILPPMIDITDLEGEDLNAANHFNAAIAMCSIAIRKAGYPSECSAMFYPPNKEVSDG
ncbi:hypothetical protein [Yersinia frederiksenii]|uniref:hypothetical protein n=1 Tax=Yersinia frederiksenii TaxID=29484 RepID=UPI0005DDF7C5|nr:hypothetical protein [Yersinia frederiksenii]CQJ02485.1 Uncharacterised protein [Yersinia frederiksenii]